MPENTILEEWKMKEVTSLSQCKVRKAAGKSWGTCLQKGFVFLHLENKQCSLEPEAPNVNWKMRRKISFPFYKGAMGLRHSERLMETWYHLATLGCVPLAPHKRHFRQETQFPRRVLAAGQWQRGLPWVAVWQRYLPGYQSRRIWMN